MKCGEEKPHCARCTRQGIRCPGYVQSLRWVTGNGNVPEIAAPRNNPSSSTPGLVDPLTTSLDEQRDANPTAAAPVPDPCNPDVDNGENAICESLWDLPGESLPELDNLSALSPSPPCMASQSGASSFIANITAFDPSCLFSLAAPTIQQQDHQDVRSFTPKSIVRSYPPPSVRLPPQLDLFVPQSLLNHSSSSWTLIEYYFKEVAALFSSYDSQMNPFRTTVSRLWGSSLAMCRTMQSMAAATLVHDFPQFGPMGQKMRREAMEILNKETTTALDDKSLLALLMLGQTASWHDPKDLGISYFNLLRKHLNTISYDRNAGRCSYTKNYQFFEEALIYWEMLLSFVTDNDSISANTTTAPDTEDSIVLQRMPHPWTGIARETHSIVQEVGRLVRRERARIRSQHFTSQEDITQAQHAIDHAQQLEQRLLNMAHPSEAEVISPGDDDTPVWHLLTMAEGYRCTGLIQLYRVFPDLLRHRLGQHSNGTFQPIYSDPIIQDSGFENTFCAFTPSPNNDDPTPRTSSSPSSPDYNTWLTEFALTAISRLRTIPMESRTRCVQPFLFVASSSELRLPRTPHAPSSGSGSSPASKINDEELESTASRTVEVLRTRKFVLGRLTSYLHVLPPKPIHVCLQLVNEVWRRMDEGQENLYWMDVMIEKGWETTMG